MDTSLNYDAARISMGKNARNFTIRVTEKMSAGRNENTTQIKKRKRLMSMKR